MRLLDEMRSRIHTIEQELVETKALARKRCLPLVQDPNRIREQIRTVEKKLNLKLDEREPEKNQERRRTLQRRLALLESRLGEERIKNIEEELSFLQDNYLQALRIPGTSYDDVQFSRYIRKKGEKKLSEADILPYFARILTEEFIRANVGTVHFLPIKDPIDYWRWPPEKFIPWAENIPSFVSSAYRQAALYERIAASLKEKSLELQKKGYSTVAVILHFNANGGTVFFLPRKTYDPEAGSIFPDLSLLEFLYPAPDRFLEKIREDATSSLSRALSRLEKEGGQSTAEQKSRHLRDIIDSVGERIDSLKERFSSIYYKVHGSSFGMYNIKKKLGEGYTEEWEGLGVGLSPRRVNMFDTAVAARYGVQAYLLEVDNLQNTSPSRMRKVAGRVVENYKQVAEKIARRQGESFEKIKNTTALLFIPGEGLSDPNQAFAEFDRYRELAKKVEEREKNKPELKKISREIGKLQSVRRVELELRKLNLERESLVYLGKDTLNMKHQLDRLYYALKLNERIFQLQEEILAQKEKIEEKRLSLYHEYNIDSPYLPLGIVSYKAGRPVEGLFFTLLEGYLLYSGIDEKDGNRIGLGFALTLTEILHNREVASEYNRELSRKLGLELEEDKVSVLASIKF